MGRREREGDSTVTRVVHSCTDDSNSYFIGTSHSKVWSSSNAVTSFFLQRDEIQIYIFFFHSDRMTQI